MIPVFRHTIIVTPAELDTNNHVNNVEYVSWMQEIAIMHSNAVGCGPVLERLGATWFVHEHRIVYDKPAFLGDEITGLTWVSEIGRVRSLRKSKFVRPADGRRGRSGPGRNGLGLRGRRDRTSPVHRGRD